MLIRPSKHSHPDKTTLATSVVLLKQLRRFRVRSFEDLRSDVTTNFPGNEPLFLPAVNLLYILGLIDYRSKTDSFEYLRRRED